MDPALSAPGPGDAGCLWSDQPTAVGSAPPRHGGPPAPAPGHEGPRRAVHGTTDADVAVVGAGLTGLWTAYYLTQREPSLRVVVVEAQTVGFGASGRNGGWCSALFPVSAEALSKRHGEAAARAMRAAMRGTVTEVGEVVTTEGIDCHFTRGGTVALARTRPQLDRARTETARAARWGDDVRLLSADEARHRVGASDVLAATFTPDCARLHPGRLVRGLAEVVEGRGVRIAEGTRAVSLEPGRVRTVCTDHAGAAGTVVARNVVRATEAWTATLPSSGRDVAPVYSLMIATEPLPTEVWAEVGLGEQETFTDLRHLIVYGQRTADDRLAFGGRGAPYHWRSSIRPGHDREPRVFAALERTLHELFPVLRDARITHRWGGPLGIARDWNASVGLDRSTGIAWAGGYVGDGLSTTNLAGRTLADLLTGHDTELTRLPWVDHRSPPWEPEPLRWLGLNAGLTAMRLADAEERLTGRRSSIARAMAPLLGH